MLPPKKYDIRQDGSKGRNLAVDKAQNFADRIFAVWYMIYQNSNYSKEKCSV
jgi:hypothetical protein